MDYKKMFDELFNIFEGTSRKSLSTIDLLQDRVEELLAERDLLKKEIENLQRDRIILSKKMIRKF